LYRPVQSVTGFMSARGHAGARAHDLGAVPYRIL